MSVSDQLPLTTSLNCDCEVPSPDHKTQHAVNVLSSLKNMWKDVVVCDFTIKVGEKNIPVHKALLVACSDYFKAMFASNMKESIDCMVDMKGVEENAVESCIDFIYTGETELTEANVGEVLQAASIIQLGKLRTACLDFLRENICEKNCISTWQLAKLYDFSSLQNQAGTYFKINFHAVIKQTEFLDFSKDDALMFILEFGGDDDSRWEASMSWIEHISECREEDMVDFFSMLNLTAFPSCKLLSSTWKSDCFRKSDSCRSRLLKRVFSTVLELSTNITIENCFLLNEMADAYKHTVEEIRSIVFRFMLKMFPAITSKEEFGRLKKKDVIALLESPDCLYFSSEKIKWNAAVSWMKANPCAKSSTFRSLLKTFDLKELPREFLQLCFFEPLWKKYPECQQILMDAAVEKPTGTGVTENFVALLSSNSSLDVFGMNEKKWHPLHYSTKTAHLKIVSLNRNLCLLDGKHLSISKNQRWVTVASMPQEPSNSSQVVSCNDCIYVVEKKMVWCYSSLSDTWKNIILPVEAGLCAAGDTKLYFVSPSPVVRDFHYDAFENLILPTTMDISLNHRTSAEYLNEKIFVCGDSSSAARLGGDGIAVACCSVAKNVWHKVSTPNNSDNIKLCIISENLAVFRVESTQVELEIYDEKWNEWMLVPNTPKFKSCGTQKRIETVCSFHVNA